MKIQNFAVVFIIIIMPIAMVLSVYTGNLIDVANRQASYDSILLNSTYDAVRAYQMNTLNNDYEAETNSKVRDINASVNSFFNSLAMGFSSSGLGKEELKAYIPAMLYTLYDGYYIYGTYDNVVDTVGGVSYNENAQINKKEYGLKPYVYYSCEYEGDATKDDGKLVHYDIIVNYTLDNYITVTGKNGDTYISKSGYYIDFRENKIKVPTDGAKPANFDQKIVTLYPDSENEVVISPEELGEYLITIDTYREESTPETTKYKVSQQKEGQDSNDVKAKYYNYIIYNNVKYYLDDEMINDDGTAKEARRENEINYSHNMTYDGIPIFFLDRDTRTYISQSTLDELKSYLGVDNNLDLYTKDKSKNKFKDVNAYYYYFKSVQFSSSVYDVLKDINLGKTKVTNTETGEEQDIIVSNLPYDENGNIVDSNGQVLSGNVIKTETYHTKYTYQNGVESHVKSTYDTGKVFNFDEEENNPELVSSSFNRHRIDVIISSIESSLVSSMANFNSYIGATYEYTMPVLEESEWERICNNITVATFMQGLTIGNYKYYSNYAIVANTKVKDFIPKESIYLQNANHEEAYNGEYHTPRCIDYNSEMNSNEADDIHTNIVGYRNIDYDRQNCKLPNPDGTTSSEYWYYLQPGSGAYECIVGQNNNLYSTDELLKGIKEDGSLSDVNGEIRRAYITALAREKGNAYRTYGYLNQELQQKTPLTEGEALYTVHYYYQDNNTYTELGKPFTSTALVGTPIRSLTLHTTPRNGYKQRQEDFIEVCYNYGNPSATWQSLDDNSNLRLIKDNETHIALYFDADTTKTKTLTYEVEYYVWNSGTDRYDYSNKITYREEKWINDNNNLNVNIPRNYMNMVLVYTDPPEYVDPGNTIETGSLIKAYYSVNSDFFGKTYIVRYHSNDGSGTMDSSTFRFFERNQLSPNKFTKSGSFFEGWALSDKGEVVYLDQDTIIYDNGSNGIKQEGDTYYLDLYAKWKGIGYQIAYQGNGSTSGNMPNSSHQYDVKSKLSKNQYKREFTVKLNLGEGKSNYYKQDSFDQWGNSATVVFNQSMEEYSMHVPADSSKYSGLFYTGTDAIIKPGKTATISYEVYSDRQVTLALKRQNSIVGQARGNDRKDGNQDLGIDFFNIPAKTTTNVYFTYKNNSNNSIYDYSVLAVEDTNVAANLTIKNPRFEIINAQSTIEGDTEIAKVSSKFLHWRYNGEIYQDEQEILNLTTQNGSILNMTAEWEDFKFNLPELYAPGYNFLGWVDEKGNSVDANKSIVINENKIYTAKWEDNIPPEVDIKVINTTINTITTSTTVTDEGSGMTGAVQYAYYIKEWGQPDSAYQLVEETNNPEYVFRKLKHNTRYSIKVEVRSDNAGNVGTDTTDGRTLKLTGNIYVKSQKWLQNMKQEGTQEIAFGASNVSGDDVYIETRKEGSDKWDKTDIVYNVEHGETVYARLTDGINSLDSISTRAWDDKNPEINVIDITAVQEAYKNINIIVNAFDRESGLGENPVFTYSYKRTMDSNWTTAGSTTARSYNFINLEKNTNYDIKVNVKDRAGNLGEIIVHVKTTYTYRIIFNGNGSTSGAMEPLTCIENVPARLTKNAYSKTGYAFSGWTFGERIFKDEDYIMNLSTNGQDVTLYAIWEDVTKPVVTSATPSFNYIDFTATDNGGSGINGYTYTTSNTTIPSVFTSCSVVNDLSKRISGLQMNTTYYIWVRDVSGNISNPYAVTTKRQQTFTFKNKWPYSSFNQIWWYDRSYSAYNPNLYVNANISTQVGHKYYIAFRVGHYGDSDYGCAWPSGPPNNPYTTKVMGTPGPTKDFWEGWMESGHYHQDTTKSWIYTETKSQVWNYIFYCFNGHYAITLDPPGGGYSRVWFCNIFDLTATCGAGNEPSLAWCDSNLRKQCTNGSITATIS